MSSNRDISESEESEESPPSFSNVISRLATLSKLPETCNINRQFLALNGFYATGNRDEMKCFSCGICVKDWIDTSDNPSKFHKRTCDMTRGGSNHNTESGASCSHVRQRTSQAFLRLAKIESPEHRTSIMKLDLCKEEDRRKTYAKWPTYPAPCFPPELAKDGFFYLGNLDRVQCFSCSMVLRNWAQNDNINEQHRRHSGNCRMSRGIESANIPMDGEVRNRMNEQYRQHLDRILSNATTTDPPDPSPEERRRLEIYLPCSNPTNPHMMSLQTRIDTFSRWPRRRMRATPQQLAKAGFFFLGESDKTKCYYCNGGLQNWEFYDNPWIEHAKWFPGCEFVMRMKGVDLVRKLTQEHPNLNRPAIRNPISWERIPPLRYSGRGSGHERVSSSQEDEPTDIAGPSNSSSLRQRETSASSSSPENPGMISLQRRIDTFQQWPDGRVTATPLEIAKAGFYYLGESDKTQCFCCGGVLQNWNHDDVPLLEHAKWNPGCEFVRKTIFDSTTDWIQEHPNFNRTPTSDIKPEDVYSHLTEIIRKEDRRRFLRELGVQTKSQNEWLDISEEFAFRDIERYLDRSDAQVVRFWRNNAQRLDMDLRIQLELCHHQPDENLQARCIYGLLDSATSLRKVLLEELEVPVSQHQLRQLRNLRPNEFRSFLQRWWESKGEHPRALLELKLTAERFVQNLPR